MPAIDDTRVYVPLRNNQLAAVELASGKVEWTIPIAGRPTLAAGDGLVFLTGPTAISARAADDGSLRWSVELDAEVTGALKWDDGWLIAVSGSGQAFAIRARDGQIIWKAPLGAPSTVPPALAANCVYFAVADGRVMAHRLLTGAPIWTRKLGGAPAEMLPLDDRIFVGAKDHFFYCLAVKNGSVKWRWRTGGEIIGAPIVDERSVFFVSLDNVVRALGRGNGHQRWSRILATRPSGGPLHFERDVVLVAGIAAEVWVYSGADGAPTSEINTPAELAVPPLLAHASDRRTRMLVVLTLEGQMQALGLSPIGGPVPGLPMFLPPPAVEPAWPPRT